MCASRCCVGSRGRRHRHRKRRRDRNRDRERGRHGHGLSYGGRDEASDVPREVYLRCQRRVNGLVVVDGQLFGNGVGVGDCDCFVVFALF